MTVHVPREMLDRYNKPGPRYTSYPTVPVWTADFGERDYLEELTLTEKHRYRHYYY